ncbi:MAG TPA: ABC transporter ATP-binding protein [Anaerolineaceae bacterium]
MSDRTLPDYDLQKAVHKNNVIGLWRLMTGFRLTYLGATLALGISALSKTGTYMLLRYFVDGYFGSDGATSLPVIYIALGFIGLAGLEGGFTFLSGRLAARTSEGITRRLRNYLFDHIQHLTFTYHSGMQTGELIQRCTSDVDAIRRFFAEQAIGMGRIILLFIVNFTALMLLNVRLALFSIVLIPIIVVVSVIMFKKMSKIYEQYQEQDAVLSTILQENLSGVRVVKAFARQEYEKNKFERDNMEKYLRGKRLMFINALFWPGSDLICGAQMMIGYVMGAMMAIRGEITPGTFLAYMGLIVWIIFPMRNLGRLIVHLSTGQVSFGRVTEIIKQTREPLDQGRTFDQPVRGEIRFENVEFAYEKDCPVLSEISFTVKPGQVVALLGSTGSGKTSLVNLLPRFYDYTAGRVYLDGVELNSIARRYLRQQIGIVEQEPFLFSRSIRENITYGVGREVSQAEVETAARAAAVHDVICTFPEGYKTLVGERGVTLSGGQKQRVAIARALLKNPRILILDDSTSSVDTETEAEIREALQTLMRERTTFIIAHRIQSIMDADLVLVMDGGKIVQKGTHETLMREENGMYRKIFEIQTRIEDELEKEIAGVGH